MTIKQTELYTRIELARKKAAHDHLSELLQLQEQISERQADIERRRQENARAFVLAVGEERKAINAKQSQVLAELDAADADMRKVRHYIKVVREYEEEVKNSALTIEY